MVRGDPAASPKFFLPGRISGQGPFSVCFRRIDQLRSSGLSTHALLVGIPQCASPSLLCVGHRVRRGTKPLAVKLAELLEGHLLLGEAARQVGRAARISALTGGRCDYQHRGHRAASTPTPRLPSSRTSHRPAHLLSRVRNEHFNSVYLESVARRDSRPSTPLERRWNARSVPAGRGIRPPPLARHARRWYAYCVAEGRSPRGASGGAGAAPTGFGGRLRRLREAAGLSQEELAGRAGLTAKAVSMLERGERRRPYPHTVRSSPTPWICRRPSASPSYWRFRGGAASLPFRRRPRTLPFPRRRPRWWDESTR